MGRDRKMNKACSVSTRSSQMSENDTSWEKATWYISESIGMKFENPDVISLSSRSYFHSTAGMNVTAQHHQKLVWKYRKSRVKFYFHNQEYGHYIDYNGVSQNVVHFVLYYPHEKCYKNFKKCKLLSITP